MKRYDLVGNSSFEDGLQERKEGEFVSYADHEKIVSTLIRLVQAKNKLLVAYRLSSHKTADTAITAIDRETDKLKKLGIEI